LRQTETRPYAAQYSTSIKLLNAFQNSKGHNMSDDIDLAQNEIDWMQRAMIQAVISRMDHLESTGHCYYCEEALPIAGQLFCDRDCARDYERVSWAQRMSGK
jgi:hypothetical protein